MHLYLSFRFRPCSLLRLLRQSPTQILFPQDRLSEGRAHRSQRDRHKQRSRPCRLARFSVRACLKRGTAGTLGRPFDVVLLLLAARVRILAQGCAATALGEIQQHLAQVFTHSEQATATAFTSRTGTSHSPAVALLPLSSSAHARTGAGAKSVLPQPRNRHAHPHSPGTHTPPWIAAALPRPPI